MAASARHSAADHASAASGFDGVETVRANERLREDEALGPPAFRRRLTTDALTALRRRRTGPGRALRRPLREERRAPDGSGEEESDSEGEEEDISIWELLCCCVGPRCCVGSCFLLLALGTWSAAITYGILRQPSYEQLATPVRVARQRWLTRAPTGAEDGFALFDRNADGRIGVDDMAVVARIVSGENPTHEQLAAYIARGDLDGDGYLDEAEYLQMLHRERAQNAKDGGVTEGQGGQGT